MKDFELVFYRKPNGECPTVDFVSSLNKVMRFKMFHSLDLLELYGNNPKGDFTKPIKDGIFECRAQTKTDITRIFFFFDKNRRIVLTHGFVKKTQRMPLAELETAMKYRADYLSREEEFAPKANEQPHPTAGPKWRPKFDELLNDAQDRTEPSKNEGRGNQPNCR